MTADFTRTRKLLATSDFKTLFIEELGWKHHYAGLEVLLDGLTFTISAAAEKRGMTCFVCSPGADGRIPDHAMRRRIERQVTAWAKAQERTRQSAFSRLGSPPTGRSILRAEELL
jgi:hypothetical protein